MWKDPENNKDKNLSARIDPNLKRRLTAKLAMEDISLQSFIDRVVREYLEDPVREGFIHEHIDMQGDEELAYMLLEFVRQPADPEFKVLIDAFVAGAKKLHQIRASKSVSKTT